MEFIAIICIPVNAAIIYFTGDSSFKKEGRSSFQKTLSERNPEYWSDAKIILLIVAIEHCLLFIKMIIARSIDDLPHSVKEAERRRPQVVK